jgi:transposase
MPLVDRMVDQRCLAICVDPSVDWRKASVLACRAGAGDTARRNLTNNTFGCEEDDMARRRRSDPKEEALRAARTLNPRPDTVRDEQFDSSGFFDARDVVQVKYEMVRRVQVDGASVVHTAAAFGFSRPSYYEAAAALARAGLPGLVPAKPGPRRGHKLTDEVLAHAEALLAADASLRPADLVEPLHARFGVRVHPRSVERALHRRRQAGGSTKSG